MKTVKFRKKYHAYNEGETAGFSDQHADWLIKKGIAEPITIPPKEEAVASKNEPKPKDPSAPQNRQSTGTSSKTK
jgi:hypothetical protein